MNQGGEHLEQRIQGPIITIHHKSTTIFIYLLYSPYAPAKARMFEINNVTDLKSFCIHIEIYHTKPKSQLNS
jgi:hypothetical protein